MSTLGRAHLSHRAGGGTRLAWGDAMLAPPPIPPDEEQRLDALGGLGLLDTPPEERFDRLTRLAALVCDAPIAMLTLVDRDRVWVKAAHGIELRELPRGADFGAHTILSDEPLVIADLKRDRRFARNPLVRDPPRVRFYLGLPLHAPGGARVGALCVLDRYPRSLDEAHHRALADLARLAERELSTGAPETTRQKLRQLQRFFDLSRDLLAITDGERFLELSPSWRRTLGFGLDELRRSPVARLTLDEDSAGARDVLLSNGDQGFILRARCADGSSRALEWIVVPDAEDGLMYAVARDVTEKLRTEGALRQSEERYRMLFTTMAEGVLLLDPRGAIVAVNPSAERLLGAPAPDLLGKAALAARFRWLDPAGEPLPAPLHPITLALSGGAPSVDFACGVETPAAELHWLSLNAAPLVDPRTGETRGAVVSFHDVTARKKVDRLKSEFVSTVSHELRTPLASVRGALGLLAGGVAGPLTESLGQMVDIALSNVERLSRLVDDILDVEKIDSGRMALHLAPLPLAPLLAHAEVSNRPFVTPLGIRVEIDAAPELVVHVDPDRFQQVMTNLLSNAAKFSPPGGLVTVRARALAAGRVRLEVHDDGPGIPAEFRDRIFERFSQADGSDRRRHGGTGLGLSIVKGLVDRMGGAVAFTSEPGHGTTFVVELPGV